MSRLPLPATEQDQSSPDLRLTDPSDLDVYLIGASGVMPAPMGPVLGGRPRSACPDHCADFVVGERGRRSAPLSSDEAANEQ